MELIKNNMLFYSFNDFYKHAKTIKYEYDKLSIDQKEIYKLYLYSHSYTNWTLLDKMWEYLNEPLGSAYYVSYKMLGVYLS